MRRIISVFTMLCVACVAWATEPFVVFQPQDNALRITGAKIVFEQNEHACVQRAVANLTSDLEKVTGQRSMVNGQRSILVGTVGTNKQIDQWVKKGVLSNLKGKREKYIIKTINNQLVIAGSDKRGTVFGIYELSQQIGVSPWYYWADVPVARHDELYVKAGEYTDGEPNVRYRGLFLNDEAPCLTSWVKNTFGTDYGGHEFYEKVFELILRLKGNFLWPAMWGWAFYADDPENSKLADQMGIIIGTSHHEPMARNHQEWARHRGDYGAWNYETNQTVLDRFFREGIERMKGTDDIVTIGMRGDGDEAMSKDADTKLLEKIVENQRKIIKEVTGRPAKETPQVWALYKEVLDYYDKGMRVPDDVLILLCDDNWGNIRRVPNAKERQHPGGWGLYYHVDYVGAPRNSKWLNVTPSQNMWEQLTLASDYGLDRMWVLNVGDLKPMEYPITLFMDMAWNPRSVTVDVVYSHTRPFCAQQFGEDQADEAARILNICCKLAGRSTAEMLDARTYNVKTGEWRQVADEYMRLEAEALRQYLTLQPQYRDAYQQIILFPVQAMSNIYQMYYAQAMNHYLYEKGDAECNLWADRVGEAFRRDSLLCASYNHDIAGGKWNGMMTQKHIGYRSWNDNFRKDMLPQTQRLSEELRVKSEEFPTGVPSTAGTAAANSSLFTHHSSLTTGGFTHDMQGGVVAMEAEHYYEAKATPTTQWTVIPFMGRTRSAVALMPYTEGNVKDASLTYRFRAPEDKKMVRVRVVTKSTLDYLNKGGLVFTVQLDNGEPQSVNFNHNLNENPENIYSIYYPTVARRVVESVIDLKEKGTMNSEQFAAALPAADGTPVGNSSLFTLHSSLHTLTLRPQDPAIVFEKVIVEAEGHEWEPSFLFGNESDYTRK